MSGVFLLKVGLSLDWVCQVYARNPVTCGKAAALTPAPRAPP